MNFSICTCKRKSIDFIKFIGEINIKYLFALHLLFRFEGSGLFLAMKTMPEERTGRILDEIERAERIFKKMCDCGDFEEEINKAMTAKQAAVAIKRILR